MFLRAIGGTTWFVERVAGDPSTKIGVVNYPGNAPRDRKTPYHACADGLQPEVSYEDPDWEEKSIDLDNHFGTLMEAISAIIKAHRKT